MMNKITRNDFTQEIAATIRGAKSGVGLSKLLKRYHERDVAKALSLLTEAERERVLRLMDVPALTAVFPYLDDAADCLAALPEARTAEVLSGMDTADVMPFSRSCRRGSGSVWRRIWPRTSGRMSGGCWPSGRRRSAAG